MIDIAGRVIGPGHPVYIVAELSANHRGDYGRAVELIEAAVDAGADAVKLQTYTADTITIDCDKVHFQASGSVGPWHGRNLHSLYTEAATPWGWFPRLRRVTNRLGITLFSTAYDGTAVDFLESMDVPAYKISAFELPDVGLLERVGATGKPVILSTGMATPDAIDEAVRALRAGGANQIALLKCTSAYPAPIASMNLRAIPYLADTYGRMVVGLSDHTIGETAAVAAVALGARIVEKHLTLSRADGGPDGSFSSEPDEFGRMVDAIRGTEDALGVAELGVGFVERGMNLLRRSLFVVEDIARGDSFTTENVRSIRPGHGLHPRHLPDVLGNRAALAIERGTPLALEMVAA